jgi:site-specific recombinase XerD
MNDIAILSSSPSLPSLLIEEDMEAAAEFLIAEKSAATQAAYRSDFRIFVAYCTARGLAAMPATAGAVMGFLSAEAKGGARASTLGRRVAAIRYAHKLGGHEPPTNAEAVKALMRGIRRTIGSAKVQKAPATADLLRAMVEACPDTLRGKRDRALLALGFAGAFRRSELVALLVEDLVEAPDGFRVTIRRSKTDQEGQGQEIGIPRGTKLRPVEAVRTWLDAARITEGYVFRSITQAGLMSSAGLSSDAVPDIVKAYAVRTGLDATFFSGHSLRAGFLTSGAEAGASVFKLMEVSRHRSVDTLRGYVRRADLFLDHAGASFL